MSRQQQGQANKTFGEAQGVFGDSQGKSNALYSQLFPQFSAEATDPTGFGAKATAEMKTNAEQSIGGGQSATVGQGNLTAARTRNAGGFGSALDESARDSKRALSSADLGVDSENAALKEAQKQEGLSGLSSLYGGNNSTMLSALGLGNQATQTGTQAGQSGWFQNFLGAINAVSGAVPKPGQA
jgi:hypothetical protein